MKKKNTEKNIKRSKKLKAICRLKGKALGGLALGASVGAPHTLGGWALIKPLIKCIMGIKKRKPRIVKSFYKESVMVKDIRDQNKFIQKYSKNALQFSYIDHSHMHCSDV